MKARQILYLVSGIFLILLNLIIDVLHYKELYMEVNDTAYTIGAFLGGHILLIIGIFLLRASYKLNRKIKLLNDEALNSDIDSIGKVDQ